MQYVVTDRNNADRNNPIVDVFATRPQAEAFAGNEDNAGEGYEVEEWNSLDDFIGDTVEDWLANNRERLAYAYNDTTAFVTWKREAVKRLVKSQDASHQVLSDWATEAESANA